MTVPKKTPKTKTQAKPKAARKAASKKAPKKAAISAAKGKRSAGKKRITKKNRTSPVSVLVIMGLLTIIVVLLNKYNNDQKNKNGLGKLQEVVTAKTSVKNSVKNKEREHRTENTTKSTSSAKTTVVPEKELAVPKPVFEQQKVVKVYFIKLNEATEKFYLTSVVRRVASDGVLENTLKALINGPRSSEKKRGMLTAVTRAIQLRNVHVKNRTAVLDFNNAIEYGAAGNILISRLDQIVYTATQFEGVDSVVITINGRKRKTLGSDGLSIAGPLHRRE